MTKKVDISDFAWKGPSVALRAAEPAEPLVKGEQAPAPQEATPTTKQSGPSKATPPRPARRNPDTAWGDTSAVGQWRSLSGIVRGARQDGIQQMTSPELLKVAASDPNTPFAPLYFVWTLENCLIAGMYEEALAVADELRSRWPHAAIDGEPLLDGVLESVAYCHQMLGQCDRADRTFEEIIKFQSSMGRETSWPWYRRGLLAEELGNTHRALWAYREATRRVDLGGKDDGLNPERARRNARRLRAGTTWVRADPETLAKELARALLRRDHDKLDELGSPTHFTLGLPHGERTFADRRLVLAALCRDLKRSRVFARPDALAGRGAKRYLITDGWVGDVFLGQILFVLERVPAGWEWSGVGATPGVTADSRSLFRTVFGEGQPMPNQPLDINISAPWPAPLSMQAGGINTWVAYAAAELAAIIAASAAAATACAAAGPFAPLCAAIAGPAAGAAAFGASQGFRYAHSSGRPCGWGPGGNFYNTLNHAYGYMNLPPPLGYLLGPQNAQYAIDFARYPRGTTRDENITAGVEVLACYDGVVRIADSLGVRGGQTLNRVVQRLVHDVPELGATPYHASYLHLDGPSRLLVSRFMWVERGAVLEHRTG